MYVMYACFYTISIKPVNCWDSFSLKWLGFVDKKNISEFLAESGRFYQIYKGFVLGYKNQSIFTF